MFSVYVRLRGLLYVYCSFGLGDVESIVREVFLRVMKLYSIVFGSCLRMLRVPSSVCFRSGLGDVKGIVRKLVVVL